MHNDRLPERRPDAVYLFGHTPDNEVGILESVNLLLDRYSKSGDEFPVYLCGGEPYRSPEVGVHAPIAYSGFTAWRDWLVDHAYLDEKDIHIVPQPRLAHTGTEAETIVRIALEKGWTSLIIVAAHMHILRAFTNAVTFVMRSFPTLKVFACAGFSPARWTDVVLSSQGSVYGPIIEVGFEAEWDRLNRWHAKGDLVSAQEVLEYVSRRDDL